MTIVEIFADKKAAGTLTDSEYGSSFTPSGISLSWSFRDGVTKKKAQDFFTNLFPESGRKDLYKEYGLPGDTKKPGRLALFLEKFGCDMQGDITVGTAKTRDITDIVTETVAKGESLDSLMLPCALAGGEPKTAVVFENGRFFSPGERPSTHILKASPLTLFEAWAMAFTKASGIEVVNTELLSFGGREALLVERFDRVFHEGEWKRLAQEDFCQQLGRSNAEKYCVAGKGVDTKDMARVMLERLSREDIRKFLTLAVFTIMIGNLDDHAKNYAVVTGPGAVPHFAPAYDITCVTTISYIGKKRLFKGFEDYRHISPQLPRAFGGARLTGQIRPRDFERMSRVFEIEPSELVNIWRENIERVYETLTPFNRDFMENDFGLSEERRLAKNNYARTIEHHLEKRRTMLEQIGEAAKREFCAAKNGVKPRLRL